MVRVKTRKRKKPSQEKLPAFVRLPKSWQGIVEELLQLGNRFGSRPTDELTPEDVASLGEEPAKKMLRLLAKIKGIPQESGQLLAKAYELARRLDSHAVNTAEKVLPQIREIGLPARIHMRGRYIEVPQKALRLPLTTAAKMRDGLDATGGYLHARDEALVVAELDVAYWLYGIVTDEPFYGTKEGRGFRMQELREQFVKKLKEQTA